MRTVRSSDRLRIAAWALGLLVLASSCGSAASPADRASAWVAGDEEAALFARWTTDDTGRVSGVIRIARLNADGTISVENHDVTGVQTGDDISLTSDLGLGATASWIGEIADDSLILYWPATDGTYTTVTLTDGSVGDYNRAVDSLRTRAAEVVSAIAEREREQARREAGERALATAEENHRAARTRLVQAFNALDAAWTRADRARSDVEKSIGDLDSEIARLEDTVASDPTLIDYRYDVVEYQRDVVDYYLDVARDDYTAGNLSRAVDELLGAADTLAISIEELRNAESLYLNEEFAPTDFAEDRVEISDAYAAIEAVRPLILDWSDDLNALEDLADEKLQTALALVPDP